MTIYSHTPSAGGLVIHNGKILVITSTRRGTTDLPKGTIEKGESIQETAIREVGEETGYRVRITKDLKSITYDFNARDTLRYRKTVSYFLMELVDDNEPIKNLQPGEDFENEWLSPDEALERLSHNDVRALVKRTIEGLTSATS